MSIDAIFDKIDAAKSRLKLRPSDDCFYRGSRSSAFDLTPSLLWRYEQAYGHDRSKKERAHREKLQEIEAGLFWDFSSRAREIQSSCISDWDVLFTMRHHTVATRLLDWTTNIAVSLYFALFEHEPGDTPCIWILNPYALNLWSIGLDDIQAPRYLVAEANVDDDWDYGDLLSEWDDPGIGWEHPIATQVIQRDARLYAQRGFFTIHGNDRRPLNEQVSSKKRILEKVEFSAGEIGHIENFLDRAGVDEYLLFPDLDSLARALHRANRIDDQSLKAAQKSRTGQIKKIKNRRRR